MQKVSIIIPVYNVEPYIKDCISSVMDQDYKNLEIIIVNDCTPDKSIIIASNLIANYRGPHIYKIISHKYNQGLSASRNTGIQEATGDFIYFLDSDDYISKNCISSLVNLYNKTHADIIIGNQIIIDNLSNKKLNNPIKLKNSYQTFHSLKKIFSSSEFIEMDCNGVAWNKLINKNFILKNDLKFNVGILYEDDIWSYKVYCHNPTITISDIPTYFYRMRPNSIMNTFTEYHFYSAIKCANIAIAYESNIRREHQTSWYASNGIEKYIIGALYKAIDKIDTTQIYSTLYHRFRKVHTPTLLFWINYNIPLKTKIKSIHYLLPLILGEKYLWYFLKYQQKIMHKKYPLQASIPSIKLSDNFWTNFPDL